MVEIIEILRQEHRNIKKLLQVMEQELNVFDRGERPDYEVFGAIIEFFKNYPELLSPSKGRYYLREV